MAEYKPKARRTGLQVPFGYYISPLDPYILIPDPAKLDALHYAFRMRAKTGVAYRDCTQWLHQATGQRMSAPGFMYAYKAWLARIKKANSKAIKAKKAAQIKEKEKFISQNLRNLSFTVNENDDITAVAEGEARKEWQKA